MKMMNESNADYHADKTHVTASMLKDLDESPRVFEAKHITGTLKILPSPQMELGTAVHCAALEPQRFTTEYIVQPDALNDRRTKAYKEWAQNVHPSMTILKQETADTVRQCVDSLYSVPVIKSVLDAPGLVERSHRWTCPISDVPCKFRPDKINPDAEIVLDIKTISNCSQSEFEKSVVNFKYFLQAAHYLAGASTIYQSHDWTFLFAVVETSPPFRCRAFSLDSEAIGIGFDTRERLLADYRRRYAENDWSEIDEHELVTVSLPGWFLRKA